VEMVEKKEAECNLPAMQSEEIEGAREKMCRWIYHSATPFTVVENKHFKAFLQKLRPDFPLPTRYDVANKYLNREKARLQKKIDASLQTARCPWTAPRTSARRRCRTCAR